MRRFHLLCEDGQAQEIEALAREYGLTEQQVLAQLVSLGLDNLDQTRDRNGRFETH